jgi:hypothetical protein
VLVYDQLMGKLDPKLVKLQFQVSVNSLGYEAAKFLRRPIDAPQRLQTVAEFEPQPLSRPEP